MSIRPALVWAGSSVALNEALQHATDQAARKPRPAASAVPPASLLNVPPVVKHITPVLRQLAGVVRSSREAQQGVKRLQAEADDIETRLGAVDRELQLVGTQQHQLTERLAAVERQQHERLGTLRRDLEAELHNELAKTRQQIVNAQAQNLTSRVAAFEARHDLALEEAIDEEAELNARELQQLQQELGVRLQEWHEQVSRLDMGPEVVLSLQESANQALARRKAVLDARREQAVHERQTILASHRHAFVEQVQEQQTAELQQRLTVKAASLRSTMAALMHKTEREEAERVVQAKAEVEGANQRATELRQQQERLQTRTKSLERQLTSQMKHLEKLGAKRQAMLTRLEETFRKVELNARPGTLDWFGETIRDMPTEVTAELASIQQRLVEATERAQRLQEQRRIIRERQIALQLSREMEEQHRKIVLRRQQEQEQRSRRAERLLTKAHRLAEHGNFDEAIRLLSEAQALNPPQLKTIAVTREEFITAKAQQQRQAQTEKIERLFAKAMKVFEEGRYEEAVPLFEHVIVQEARMEQELRMAERRQR